LDPNHLQLAVQLRRELHQRPEVSNHESWTKQRLIDFLREHTRLEIHDRGRWFYAVYRAPVNDPAAAPARRPNIAFRADFDAIRMPEGLDIPHASRVPGVSHKCGHDGHAATLAGFALEVDQQGADRDVFLLFQHAEETGDGAAECVAFIGENQIDEIFAYHNMSGMPQGSINVIDGTSNCASKGITIHMEGAPAHASMPEHGVNPAFAIAEVILAIPELIAPDRYKGLVLCTVIQVAVGERAFGIAASKGDLLLTIRALYESEMDQLQRGIEEVARARAAKHGVRISFTYHDHFPETSNHKVSSDKIRAVARQKGFPVMEMPAAHRASEDYGHYLKHTKGAMCYIGNGVGYPPVHTYPYDFPDDIIETAVELFRGLAGMDASRAACRIAAAKETV
jgi:amidohydrolase